MLYVHSCPSTHPSARLSPPHCCQRQLPLLPVSSADVSHCGGARSDQGNHDIGFHSANITSPHIDALAKAGRELKRH